MTYSGGVAIVSVILAALPTSPDSTFLELDLLVHPILQVESKRIALRNQERYGGSSSTGVRGRGDNLQPVRNPYRTNCD